MLPIFGRQGRHERFKSCAQARNICAMAQRPTDMLRVGRLGRGHYCGVATLGRRSIVIRETGPRSILPTDPILPTEESAMPAKAVGGYPSCPTLRKRQISLPRSDPAAACSLPRHITAPAHPFACATAPLPRTTWLFCQPNIGENALYHMGIIIHAELVGHGQQECVGLRRLPHPRAAL
jgi:hypothetical protein